MSFQHSEFAPDPHDVEIRDAATVMIVREGDAGPEVCMVQRGARLAFGARAWVFPGGRVDTTDRVNLDAVGVGLTDAEASQRLDVPEHGLSWWLAACRESLEEAGLLLAAEENRPADAGPMRERVEADPQSFVPALLDAGVRLRFDALHDVARFITPLGPPRRFDTRFFLTEAPAGQEALHDDGEMVDSCWISPGLAIDRWRDGDFPLMSVTHRMLACLDRFDSVDEMMALAAERPEERRVRVNDPDGDYLVLLPGEPGYEHAELEVEHGWVRLWR